MENGMMTQEDVKRIQFNSQHFHVLDKRNANNGIVFYFAALLGFASQSGYISEDQANIVSSNLTSAIIANVGDSVLKVSNCLYVTSLWLRSMSNWDAFSALMTCTNLGNAEKIFASAKQWFKQRLSVLSITLNKVRSKCVGVNCEYLTKAFSSIKEHISKLKRFEGDFKDLHNSGVPITYFFIMDAKKIKSSDYLLTLENTIKVFSLEVSILSKVNISEFIHLREKVQNDFFGDFISRIESLEKERAKTLQQLKEEKEAKLLQFYESDARYDEWSDFVAEQFKALYPGMSPEVDEAEFEAYFKSIEDLAPKLVDFDPETVTTEYFRKVKAVNAHYDNLIRDVEHYEQSVQASADFSESSIEVTLENVIKEYALFSLCKKNNVAYPSTIEEKSYALLQLPLNVAIQEFIGLGLPLSEEEIQYLSCV